MQKTKTYTNCRFSAEVLTQAYNKFSEYEIIHHILKVEDKESASWKLDNWDEFLAEFRKGNSYAKCFIAYINKAEIDITYMGRDVIVSCIAESRSEIENFFNIFEENYLNAKLKEISKTKNQPIVFIGHGRNQSWRELKDHLQDKHKIKVEAYETGSRAGHTIRDILESMLSKSSLALLVLTGEDSQADESIRARQNVVHEVGLFQGRLGFSKAIILKESGVELFTNIDGIQYIGFSKNNIKETFGEIVATINREFEQS